MLLAYRESSARHGVGCLDPPQYHLSDGTSVALDLIRGASAQVVLIGHLISGLQLAPMLLPPHQAPMQNAAVVAFFLLSGFLITHVVMRRRTDAGYGFATYFWDRFARIYSGFVPAIAVVFVLDSVQLAIAGAAAYDHHGALDMRTAVGNVLMLQDHPAGLVFADQSSGRPYALTSFGSGRTFWTLAIEWWIYMTFGWVMLAGAIRQRHRVFYWAVLIVLSIVPIWNLVGGRGNGLTLVWLAGAAIHLIMAARVLHRIPAAAMTALACILTGLAFVRLRVAADAYDAVFALLLAAALCCIITAIDSSRFTFSPTTSRIVRFVAGYSFTLFLTHLSVYELMARWLDASGADVPRWALFVAILVVANALAIAVASVTETRHRSLASWLKARLMDAGRTRSTAGQT